MRAVTITRHGPPSVLEVRDYPHPEPAAGQVQITVHAAGLNFAEIAARQGLYPDAPQPPCVVGYEISGTVERVGKDVRGVSAGDRVLALTRFGGHATSAVVDEAFVFGIPEAMSYPEAAAIPVNYLTAHHMLFHIGTVHPGSAILVHMAAGGVGTAVLQLLSTVPDLTIFGTASAPKHEHLRKLGCTHPIDYRSEDYVEVVRRVTSGRGADIVLDALGGPDWKRGWNLLAPAGRLVAYGFANAISGPKRNLLHIAAQAVQMPLTTPLLAMNQNRSLQGVNLGHLWDEARVLRRQMERLVSLYKAGVVRPHVYAEVPFERAADAHEMLESRRNVGKVVLVPG